MFSKQAAVTCSCVQDSMHWMQHAGPRAEAIGFGPKIQSLRGTVLRVSSTCGGVLTPELATRIVSVWLGSLVEYLWTCEKDTHCQEEIVRLEHRPDHLYINQWNFLKPSVQKALSDVPEEDVDERRRLIMSTPTVTEAHCGICGGMCKIQRADVHVGGTPCVHDSSFGKRDKQKGKDAWVLMVYCRQRRDLKEPQWIAENVTEQGDAEMRRNLGDMYDMELLIVCPSRLGWSTRRRRQFICGKLKGLNVKFVHEIPWLDQGCKDAEDVLHYLFDRNCTYTPAAYCVATEEELAASWQWAFGRRETAARHALKELG